MENELYEVPEHYLLCFNDNCSKAQTCLHRIVAQGNYIKDNVVNAVNPARFNETNCTYYAPNTPVRLAYGMLHIFDNVLARDIAAMILPSPQRHIAHHSLRTAVHRTSVP